MTDQPSISSIVEKIGPLPAGFTAYASTSGVGVVATDDWCVCIIGVYNEQEYVETYYLTRWQLAFLSAVRDKLMMRHWQRMVQLGLASIGMESLMRPYSEMERLNHARVVAEHAVA